MPEVLLLAAFSLGSLTASSETCRTLVTTSRSSSVTSLLYLIVEPPSGVTVARSRLAVPVVAVLVLVLVSILVPLSGTGPEAAYPPLLYLIWLGYVLVVRPVHLGHEPQVPVLQQIVLGPQ